MVICKGPIEVLFTKDNIVLVGERRWKLAIVLPQAAFRPAGCNDLARIWSSSRAEFEKTGLGDDLIAWETQKPLVYSGRHPCWN